MESEGCLVFANRDAATRGIKELTGSIARIELRGYPVVVDDSPPTLRCWWRRKLSWIMPIIA